MHTLLQLPYDVVNAVVEIPRGANVLLCLDAAVTSLQGPHLIQPP